MADTQISEFDFNNLCEQLTNHKEDKDRMRLLRAVIDTEHWTFEAWQVYEFLQIFKFGPGKLECAEVCYSRVVDPENYEEQVVADFFADEQTTLKETLGL